MTTGCEARKKVQRTDGDPLMVDVVYEGVHSCAGVHSAASSKSNLRPTKSIQLFDVVYHGEHTCDLQSTHSNDVEPIRPQSGLDDDMCTDDTTTVSTRHDSNTDASSISFQLDWTNCKDESDGLPTTL